MCSLHCIIERETVSTKSPLVSIQRSFSQRPTKPVRLQFNSLRESAEEQGKSLTFMITVIANVLAIGFFTSCSVYLFNRTIVAAFSLHFVRGGQTTPNINIRSHTSDSPSLASALNVRRIALSILLVITISPQQIFFA